MDMFASLFSGIDKLGRCVFAELQVTMETSVRPRSYHSFSSITPPGMAFATTSLLQSRASLITKVGSYVVGSQIGVGGTSIVYRGVHSVSGEAVALKFLDSSFVPTADMACREITLLKKLCHPNLVKLHDIFHMQEEQLLVLAMDYLPGGDLFDWITSRQAKEDEEAALLFSNIAKAVQYCHSQMVVHRDLKPENAMLDASGTVRLVDFGLSQVMNAGKLMHTFCGSPIYTAPEILQETPYVGPEVDVWSLGVMLYTMVTGLFPWKGQTIQEQLKNAMLGHWTVEPSLSPSCRHLISRMLCVDPSLRATMAEVLSHPWVTKASPSPSPSPSPTSSLSSLSATTTTNERELNSAVIQHLLELGFQEGEIRRKVLEEDKTSQEYELYNIYIRNGLGDSLTSVGSPSSSPLDQPASSSSLSTTSPSSVSSSSSSSQSSPSPSPRASSSDKRCKLRLPKILSRRK